jgi:hypothetical protein
LPHYRKPKTNVENHMQNLVLIFAACLAALNFTAKEARADGQFLKGCFAVEGHEKEFRRTTVEWREDQRGAKRGETMLVYAVVNVEDKATVCGMYLNDGVVPQAELKRLLATGEIRSGRQVLVRNLSYFTNACKAGGCKLCAPCFMTPLNWKSAYGRTKPKFVPGMDVPVK